MVGCDEFLSTFSARLGGKERNELLHFFALTLRTGHLFLLMFADAQYQCEFMFACLTKVLVRWHMYPPFLRFGVA